MKAKFMALLVVLVLASTVYWAQEENSTEPATATQSTSQTAPNPHSCNITREEEAQKNPLRFSEISVERGKKLFDTQCAMCHGEKGDGKGELVEELKIHPPDFTKDDTLKKRTDGALFAIIDIGSAVMPGQSKRMKEIHKWELVNYLRALGGKTPLKSTEEELNQGTAIVHDSKN